MKKSKIRTIIKEEILKESAKDDQSYIDMKVAFEKNVTMREYLKQIKDGLGEFQQWMEDTWIEGVMDRDGVYSNEEKNLDFEQILGNWIDDLMDDTEDFLIKKIKSTYKKTF